MGFHKIHRAAATAGFLFAAIILPASAQAQAVVRGVLYDDVTGSPLRGTVMLVDPRSDAPVVHAVTDTLGIFTLKTERGTYQIAAVRAGYTAVLSAPISLEDGERMTIKVPIAEQGDPQHRIGVLEHVRPDENAVRAAAQQREASRLGGFESRRALGTGLHYDRAALAKRNVSTLGEFLQSVPGMAVTNPYSASSMQMTRSQAMTNMTRTAGIGTACHVGWFVDGQRVDIPGRSDPLTDGLGSMQLNDIEALEIFRGLSEMPPQFAYPDLRCGAVAIWTRHG